MSSKGIRRDEEVEIVHEVSVSPVAESKDGERSGLDGYTLSRRHSIVCVHCRCPCLLHDTLRHRTTCAGGFAKLEACGGKDPLAEPKSSGLGNA